jgi:hypothetical protein
MQRSAAKKTQRDRIIDSPVSLRQVNNNGFVSVVFLLPTPATTN